MVWKLVRLMFWCCSIKTNVFGVFKRETVGKKRIASSLSGCFNMHYIWFYILITMMKRWWKVSWDVFFKDRIMTWMSVRLKLLIIVHGGKDHSHISTLIWWTWFLVTVNKVFFSFTYSSSIMPSRYQRYITLGLSKEISAERLRWEES